MPEASAPILQPEAPRRRYIPEWVWNVIQGILTTAVVGAYVMFYSMHDDIQANKRDVEQLQKDVAALEGKVEASSDEDKEILTSLAAIKAELPHIKKGVDDLGAMLRSR